MENLIPKVKVADVVTVLVIVGVVTLVQQKFFKIPVVGEYLPGGR